MVTILSFSRFCFPVYWRLKILRRFFPHYFSFFVLLSSCYLHFCKASSFLALLFPFSFPFSCFLHLLLHSTDIPYTSLAPVLKTQPSLLRWKDISTLSLPAFCSPPHNLLWLSQREVLSQGQKGEVGLDLWLREGRREKGGDQSDAFKLLIISIKALQDNNPVRLLTCTGLWARPNYDWE